MKVAVIHPRITGVLGGAKAVLFGAAQELADRGHEVTVYSEHDEPLSQINQFYGYDIPDSVRLKPVTTPLSVQMITRIPRFEVIKQLLLSQNAYRTAKQVEDEFDAVVFTDAVHNVGPRLDCPTIQYIHRAVDGPTTGQKHRGLSDTLLGTMELLPTDAVLFNSAYTERRTHSTSRIRQVVNPPVVSDLDMTPWEHREDRMVAVGRILPAKQLEDAIAIADRIGIELVIAGTVQDEQYLKDLREMAGSNVSFQLDASWDELKPLIERSKIGILCKEREDFGISVAEYMQAGVLPLVHDSGGPREIVPDSRYTYSDVLEAAEKASELLKQGDSLITAVAECGNRFSTDRFGRELNDALQQAVEDDCEQSKGVVEDGGFKTGAAEKRSLLIVAFDGLDYDLIQEYGCSTFLEMDEFGTLDNTTGVHKRKTPELFASFITGTTHEHHGIKSFKKSAYQPFSDVLMPPSWMQDRIPGLTAYNRAVKSAFKYHMPQRRDLCAPTIFDLVSDSEALNVPVYNENSFIERFTLPLEKGYSLATVERDIAAEHWYRQKELRDAIQQQPRLLMAHFHKPDAYQHFYAPDGTVRSDKLRQVYDEIDRLAADILRLAEDRYDTVLFMSDHGLPEGDQHNRNAFYASTTETGLDTPHITDFHDLVLSIVEDREISTDLEAERQVIEHLEETGEGL